MSLVLLGTTVAAPVVTPPAPVVDCHTLELAVAVTITLEVAADPCNP